MTPAQVLLLRLIALSQISWDEKSIQAIAKWLGADPWVGESFTMESVAVHDQYSLYCLGCNTEWETYLNSYPTILTRCSCCSTKPLKTKDGRWVYPGEAKLEYIDQALYFSNQETRNYFMHLHLPGRFLT